jgi:hypothetical protein
MSPFVFIVDRMADLQIGRLVREQGDNRSVEEISIEDDIMHGRSIVQIVIIVSSWAHNNRQHHGTPTIQIIHHNIPSLGNESSQILVSSHHPSTVYRSLSGIIQNHVVGLRINMIPLIDFIGFTA